MYGLDFCNEWCEKYKEYATIPLRVAIGLLFLLQGWGKVNGVAGVATFFSSLGIPSFLAPVVAWAELIGGLLILLGLLTRCAAAVLSIIMVVALLTAHRQALFSLNIGGFALAFVALGGLLALKLLGSGPFALEDFVFKKGKHKKK